MSFLPKFENIDDEIEEFWDKNKKNIKDFYYENQREDDLVTSASPEFLLRPICQRLGISRLIASRVDKYSGRYAGENNWGEEKVKRFYEVYPNGEVEEFYSDSYSDDPMAKIADRAYLVKGDQILDW